MQASGIELLHLPSS